MILERIHLVILHEVQRQGSLTSAAQTLHLTQSALSHCIRKLEQRLGIKVWRRDGRRLQPTQAGQYLLDLAASILPQLLHAEERLRQLARGERGTLRIGMECHPCYRWLLHIVSTYLSEWPDVDVDVKQKFQFGGVSALLSFDIDILVTPDPPLQPGLRFESVFDYEQVLVVARNHPLAHQSYVTPAQLAHETLITYPVTIERLDIYNRFLLPAGVMPQRHKTIEATEIMLQMVANRRGVTALPRWLAQEFCDRLSLTCVRLGPDGLAKQLFVGFREADISIDYVNAFVSLARQSGANVQSHENQLQPNASDRH